MSASLSYWVGLFSVRVCWHRPVYAFFAALGLGCPDMAPDVLFITRKWPPAIGGMETYSVELAKGLAACGALTLFALPGKPDGDTPSTRAIIGFGLRTAAALIRLRWSADTVHGGDMALWPLVWIASLARPSARLVLSAHGTDVSFGFRKGLRAKAYNAYMRIGARLLRRATIITNSEATAALVTRIGYRNTSTVPLAATASPPQSSPAPVPDRYVLFVGRLKERKGCGWFIRNVLDTLPSDIHLKVAGGDVDPSEGEALSNPRVDFLGYITGHELAELRRRALAVIIPNVDPAGDPFVGFEGFGLTAPEAALDGAVVCAAALHGIPDAVIDGETGFLLPTGDAPAWTGKLEEIANWSPAQRAAYLSRSQARARQHFNWDRVVRQSIAAYGPQESEQQRADQPLELNQPA